MLGMSPEVSQAMETARRRLYELLEAGWEAEAPLPEEQQWTPPVEIQVTVTEMTLTMEISGVEREAVDVNLHGATLTISGRRQRPDPTIPRRLHQSQRPWGAFRRSFKLPWPLESDSAAARLQDGVLTVRARRLGAEEVGR